MKEYRGKSQHARHLSDRRTPSCCCVKEQRRGGLLLLVLITGTIISIISLGALVVQNAYLTQSTSIRDASSARWAARSGIAAATRDVTGSTAWRTEKTPGQWYSDVESGTGQWSVEAIDPTDNSFMDSASDPVLLSSTAAAGNAVQRNSSLLLAETVLRQTMLFHACCGDDMTIENAVVEGPGWIGARDSLSASGGSSVQCDVMTGGTLSGAGLMKRVRAQSIVEPLPAFSDFSDIIADGTSVSFSSIPEATVSSAEPMLNRDFGRGDAGWEASPGGTLTSYSYGGVGNTSCIVVSGRPDSASGLVHDVTGIIRKGLQTNLYASVMPLSSNSPFELSLIVTTTSGTTTAASWTSPTVNWGNFYTSIQTISTTVTPTWSGRLISAQFKVRTSGSGSAGTQSFLVDNMGMRLTSAPPGKAVVRNVISSGTNPFGVTSNSSGIYVLDCGGADLTISDSMIVGTLIIQNADTVRVGPGPVQWRPAAPGMPALVVDGDLVLEFSRFGLTERELGVNLNPSGTPDENGSTDSSQNDTYLPGIRGLIYASGDVELAGDLRIEGCVLAGDDMIVGQRVAFSHAPQYLTIPRQATHATQPFLRDTASASRLFD